MKALDKQTHTYVGAQERLEQLVSWWSITEENMPKPYDQSSDSVGRQALEPTTF